MKIPCASVALLAGVSLFFSSCVAPVGGYGTFSYATNGYDSSVAWTNASYDANGFPIFGYSYGRPVYGYTAAGAAVFTVAALTALCFVPRWKPAPWYDGPWHYPPSIHRVAVPPRFPHGHSPASRPPGGLQAPIHRNPSSVLGPQQGQRPGAPGMNNHRPGQQPGMPGVNNNRPGQRPGTPGVNNNRPGQRPGTPGVNNNRPGQRPGTPGVNNNRPGQRPDTPGVNNNRPGQRPSTPGINNNRPGQQPSMPGMNNNRPGQRPSTPSIGNSGRPSSRPAVSAPSVSRPSAGGSVNPSQRPSAGAARSMGGARSKGEAHRR